MKISIPDCYIYLVDRRRYPSSLKAIFWSITLMRFGHPLLAIATLSVFLACFAWGYFYIYEPVGRYTILLLCPLSVVLPFFFSFLSYYSILEIRSNNYRRVVLGLNLRWKACHSIVEIHHLPDSYNGCFRIRESGIAETSGFLLHWKELPEPLKVYPVIEIKEN